MRAFYRTFRVFVGPICFQSSGETRSGRAGPQQGLGQSESFKQVTMRLIMDLALKIVIPTYRISSPNFLFRQLSNLFSVTIFMHFFPLFFLHFHIPSFFPILSHLSSPSHQFMIPFPRKSFSLWKVGQFSSRHLGRWILLDNELGCPWMPHSPS